MSLGILILSFLDLGDSLRTIPRLDLSRLIELTVSHLQLILLLNKEDDQILEIHYGNLNQIAYASIHGKEAFHPDFWLTHRHPSSTRPDYHVDNSAFPILLYAFSLHLN